MALTATITPAGGISIVCQSFSGFISGLQDVADVYHRLGQVGAGVQSLGRRAKASRCTAITLCTSYATAVLRDTDYNELRSKFVTVLDSFGTRRRCICHDVDARIVAGRHGWSGTLYPFRVEAELVLEYVGPAPSVRA